ncbi:MAG: trypsin-like peptidase domain-containing protein [Firmicutes bacterium]|nr:trypsin-like peptidase domain-containing protein [Bacillota bacterium]
MASIGKTVAAAIVGFAVGAGAVTGGLLTYEHLEPTEPHIASAGVVHYATVAENTPATLPLGPDTISNVVKRVSPAVVKIVAQVPQNTGTNPFFNQFFGSLFGNQGPVNIPPQYQTDIGSGFFFNSQGYLLTNDHVINGATRIDVVVPGYKNPFPATVVGADYATDLAVLKINPPKPVPYLVLGNSNNTPVGSWVIAIGNPYNLSHTVTVGVISAKGRPLTIGHRQYRNLLQTSAAINPGNSGGPLLNLAGQVVGINTAVAESAQGIGFAIPTSTVDQILPQLMTYHKVIRPWIGVWIATDDSSLARQYGLSTSRGVVIAYVDPSSPAAQAGLQAGEVITAVNGRPVDSAQALEDIVHRSKVNQTLTLTINRQGQVLTRTVTVGQEPNGPLPTPPASPFGG